jgi:RNA polymerase sigma factor (sigma-70 family)
MAVPALHSALQYVRLTAEAADTRSLSDRQLLESYRRRRDEAAFAALVRRHSRLVFSAVRHVLSDSADVDDAFQATFLVLILKAGSVRWQPSIGNWLYGVAHRIAVRARARAHRRKTVESSAGQRRSDNESADLTWREAVGVLHEELDGLPDALRLPLLLCYLEGQSRDEAAAQLGCSASTLKGRLETGRKRLRTRLTRRGVELSAGLLAALTVEPSRAASPLLIRATAQLAAGAAPSATVVALATAAAGVTAGQTKLAAGLLLALGLVSGIVVGLSGTGPASPISAPAAGATSEDPPAKAVARLAPDDVATIPFSGRILGPGGQPVDGANVYLRSQRGSPWHRSQAREYAKTGPDGRFAFAVPNALFGQEFAFVAAAAANHGADWLEVPTAGKTDDLTLHLVRDDMPITGQIVDLEGKPVAGATLTVMQVSAAPDEDLALWLEAIRDKQRRSTNRELEYLSRYTTALPLKATTDVGGRFRLTGIGRNRLVRAQLDGPTIASQDVRILTRPGPPIEATEFEGKPEYNDPRRVTTYFGADFRHVAAPTRPIVGVVRDQDTKKPLAGFSVRSLRLANHPVHYWDGQEPVRTTTDSQGRFRLVGLPMGTGNKLRVLPPDDMSYLATNVEAPVSPGLDPVTINIELKRGVWVDGKITDKVTGQPVRVGVLYFPLDSNPNRREYRGVEAFPYASYSGSVAEDGRYRVVALPGPGRLIVPTPKNHYLRATQREDEYRITGPDEEGVGPSLYGSNCGAFARIDPALGAESVKCDITLIPGWKFTGTVLGPDGQPLAGTENFLLAGSRWDREATKTAVFTAWFNPHEPYEILCRHFEKRLVGTTFPPKENGGSVTVRMEPAATVTGRLLDAHGKPRAGADLRVMFQPKRSGGRYDYLPEPVRTDANGRFRVDMLLPGLDYRLNCEHAEIPFGAGLRAGETTSLGDVRIKR